MLTSKQRAYLRGKASVMDTIFQIGKGGINDGRLTPEAIKRGLDAIDTHMKTLASLGKVDKIVAVGTSAMRNAANADEFSKAVEEKYRFFSFGDAMFIS